MSIDALPAKPRELYLQYAEYIRRFLANLYGTCLITEHGNTALCQGFSAAAGHSFHPHFLLFPNAPDISAAADDYFGHCTTASSIGQAVALAADRQYLLISPSAGEYRLYFPRSDLPRQFARVLVAEGLGVGDLASWRDHPRLSIAIGYATYHRTSLFSSKQQ